MERSWSNLLIGIGIFVTILLVVNYRSLRKDILNVFGGSIDKMEFAGLMFLIIFIYMIYKEGNRTHEWSLYNDLYIIITGSAALVGLGLGKVLDTVQNIKGISTTKRTENVTIESTNSEKVE